MIERADFQEHFQYYDKEVVVEIIDLFLKEYPRYLTDIRKSMDTDQMDLLKLQAHSLKGLAATFLALPLKNVAGTMETKAENKENTGLKELFLQMEILTAELASELRAIRDEWDSLPEVSEP